MSSLKIVIQVGIGGKLETSFTQKNPETPTQKPWPLYYLENLILGDESSGIGVLTLWTPREFIAQSLDSKTYRVLGQLYSNEGINPLLRNILANPSIRTLLLCGQDRIGSADALSCLMENGLNENYEVIGKEEARVDKEIPIEAIEAFRKHVKLVDRRGLMKPTEIAELLENLDQDNSPWREPEIFPEPEILVNRFPSEGAAYIYRGRTVATVWPKILHGLLRFGEEKKSNHSAKQRELLNLTAVITDENPDAPKIPDYMAFTREHYEGYLPQVMSAQPVETLAYTYGMRLRDFKGINQVNNMIETLRKEPWSRQAVAVLWDVLKDHKSKNPPCLCLVSALIKDERLMLTAYLRSNDMFRAWPENALALRSMQKEIADALRLPMGPLTTISSSAHLYEANIKAAEEVVERAYPKLPCEQDQRGNYVIRTQVDVIEVLHLSPSGRKLEQFTGKTAVELMNQLASHEGVSVWIHAMDLGAELQKAELAIQLGVEYTQDRPLPI